uniref:Ribonuclease H-like domain-containing protein n=1 Tax=Tanacetum cinerariifolium TaxID=118510 RepID=A0A699HW65_TANCI|nr:ribonuclease H-like domain-containing protein [Tanacetum cinerariifolium]
MNFVSSNVYMGLVYSVDVASVWKDLESTYDKVDGYVIFNLLKKISSIKQDGSYVADYYHRLNSLWREFNALTKELGLHNQLMKLMQFLMESHRGIPEPSGVTESKMNATSFAVKGFNVNRRNNFTNNNNRGPNPNLSCKNYSMIGHTIERCHELIGYPPGFKKVANPIKHILIVCFEEEKCYIRDLKKETILGTGSESSGLYMFDMELDNNLGKVNMDVSCYVAKDLWHNRLGHPADEVLNVLKNDLNMTKSTNVSTCEVCHRAKQTKDPIFLSDNKSKKLSELIYLDLWGLYNVTNIEGFKYFLTIVDDFSRAVWVYLIKTKDEVFDVFDAYLSRKWFEKYILFGYASVKKAYKIFSLDNRSVFYSRDVKFNETVFPFKVINKSLNDVTDVEFTNKADHLTFFGNVHNEFRRSSRVSKLPAKLNDYVTDNVVEDVYMDLPLGYDQGNNGKVCKLNNFLYGLKHAPRKWNAKLTIALIEHGFFQSKFDYSFTRESGDVLLTLLVYVDDIVVTENCKDSVGATLTRISFIF